MTRSLAFALLLASCVPAQQRTCTAVQTQSDVGLIVGAGAIMIGTGVAVDPTSVRDSHDARQTRTTVELAAAGVALAGIVAVHAATLDAQECQK